MKRRLALTIALAGFGVATALGVGMAGADSSSSSSVESGQPIAPITAPTVPVAPTPACSNGIDDDGDGLIDMADPGCTSPSDTSEASAPAPAPEPTEEAAPVPEPESGERSGGVHVGATIAAHGGGSAGGGVKHNQTIGASGRGGNGAGGGGGAAGGGNGGVSAPPATAGVQPPASSSGGSAFGSGGAPTTANPTTTIATFGPAPIGVPNFVIDSFEIPPFLLPIYQACGTQYGIPWEVLASINKIETAFGTNLSVSSAGAVGWMQFLPSSWARYGVDANGDGRKDPYNPIDAICGAANYLKAAGGAGNLYKAILAYNHADWYAQEVLLYARAYGKLPGNLIGSLTGLTQGAHFPVAANARYADEISTREALRNATPKQRSDYGNAAKVIGSSPTRRGINIYADEGAPVVAVNDGVVKKIGRSKRLGRFLILEDAYGNRYIYAGLGQFVGDHRKVVTDTGKERRVAVNSQDMRPRIFALPDRPGNRARAKAATAVDNASAVSGSLHPGSKVIAGTVLAHIGAAANGADPHINFAIRPAGRGAPRIDPKPILDGWKLLEATAIYRADGRSPFNTNLGIGGILLLPKEALQRRVLADKHLSIYGCGRTDIATGRIDRRVLAVLEFLVAKGFSLGVSSLECGHSELTTSGNVSEHSTGDAVDISTIDGVPVKGHQGPGTLTDALIKTVLQLQGTMHPHQVISLENLPGPTSFALPDHYDHVHIGYFPAYETAYVSPFVNATTGRIDQGVDFTGIGPIAAVGDARILATGAPGWPEGGGVLYQLLDGPQAGQVIFVYEGVRATVKAGQQVAAGEQIGTFIPGGSIEMGFADVHGVPLSHAEYVEGKETFWGRRMALFLSGLGGPTSLSLDSGLSPDKWNRLVRRLGEISNPTVPTKPSRYSLPAGHEAPAGAATGGPGRGD